MITTVLYILECDHVMPGGRFDRETFCGNCGMTKRITDVHVFEWKAVCRNCSFSRWTGLAKAVSDHYARVHATKYPTHALNVLYIRNKGSVEIQKRILG